VSKYAVIGFGCAGYSAAKTLRELDPEAQIDVYSNTPDAPANPMRKKMSLGVILVSLVILASCILLILVWQGIL